MKPALVTQEYRNKHIEGSGKPVSVGRLIRRLQQLDPNMPVFFSSDGFNEFPATAESLLASDTYALIGLANFDVIGEAA